MTMTRKDLLDLADLREKSGEYDPRSIRLLREHAERLADPIAPEEEPLRDMVTSCHVAGHPEWIGSSAMLVTNHREIKET